MNEAELCSSLNLNYLKEFQTLLTGFLAIIAAVVTTYGLWKSAKLPVDAQKIKDKKLFERKKNYKFRSLAEELRLISNNAKRVNSTIRVQIAANKEITDRTRSKIMLHIPETFQDWELMSLLDQEMLSEALQFQRQIIDHNRDMTNAGGVFGDDNFKVSIKQRIETVSSQAMRLSNKFISLTQET